MARNRRLVSSRGTTHAFVRTNAFIVANGFELWTAGVIRYSPTAAGTINVSAK